MGISSTSWICHQYAFVRSSEYIKMQPVPELKSIFLLFFVFGQTRCFPTNENHPFKRVLSILLKFIYLLVLVWLAYWMLNSNIKLNDQFTSVLARIPFLYYITSNLVAIFSEWSNPLISPWLYNRIIYVIHYTRDRVRLNLSLNSFRTKFDRKVIIAMCEAIITFIIKYHLKSLIIQPFMEFIFLTATVYRYFALFHALLLIDLIAFIISTFNKHLKSLDEHSLNCDNLYVLLRHLKWIQYNIFRVTSLLNER